MVSGSNDLPELKIKAPIVQPPARRIPTEPTAKVQPEATRKLIQAPDSVQLSPRAQAVSQVRAVVESTPEVRPARVEEASAKLRAQIPNSSALNAQLAEKLLTEN
jgi:hypothetical protein